MEFPLTSAFLAIPLEGDAKRRFHALQESLMPWESFLRFQDPASPHLTLYFWPEVYGIEYPDIAAAARNIASTTEPFRLALTEAETFGDKGNEKVLYLAPEFSPALATLKKRCPWPNPPNKPFHPHVTLARIGHAQRFRIHRKKIMKALDDADVMIDVDRIRLYADVGGKKQTVLEEFRFG
jgi:2'-5' RNA ligase